MKTIKELIRISNENLEAVREIRRRERMHKVYSECEELKDTDAEIVSARKRRLVAVIDRDDKLIARLDTEIDKLNDRRERIIEANGIDPDFDKEVNICSKCSDTGFTTGKGGTVQVCSCREDDVKECFTYSGLEQQGKRFAISSLWSCSVWEKKTKSRSGYTMPRRRPERHTFPSVWSRLR